MSIRKRQNSGMYIFSFKLLYYYWFTSYFVIFLDMSATVVGFHYIISILIFCYISVQILGFHRILMKHCIIILFSRINCICLFVGVSIQEVYIFIANYCIIIDVQKYFVIFINKSKTVFGFSYIISILIFWYIPIKLFIMYGVLLNCPTKQAGRPCIW